MGDSPEFCNLLQDLCQNLPTQGSISLVKFLTPGRSVGQFSQAMKAAKLQSQEA
jgi:hypothetical protein